jgi:ubiquinone/menaquinone biosynthesis C-methylase UbiE
VTEADPRWYESFFDDDWLVIALGHDDERTPGQVDAIVERLGLKPGDRVLDVACGHGRHALPLAQRGLRVTGLDSSERSLEHARRAADGAGVEIEYVHGDMRELPWTSEFDAAINVYTAFGYFADESEDERALRAVARALRPGGSFFIDTFNPTALVKGFRPQGWSDLPDGRVMLESREYDVRRGRSNAVWTLVGDDRRELRSSVRAYTYPELASMLRRAGLELVADWGGFDGAELGVDTWRMQILARRAPSQGVARAAGGDRRDSRP